MPMCNLWVRTKRKSPEFIMPYWDMNEVKCLRCEKVLNKEDEIHICRKFLRNLYLPSCGCQWVIDPILDFFNFNIVDFPIKKCRRCIAMSKCFEEWTESEKNGHSGEEAEAPCW